MEHLLEKAKIIRLKTHNGKYLIASKDEKSVRQSRDGSSVNALWSVEFVDNQHYLRLKSCYGKYLTASNVPFLPKVSRSRKVIQTLPKKLSSATEWEVEQDGSLYQIRLKTRYGHFLRPFGGIPPWRNLVTHDVPHRKKSTLWEIDIMETHLVHRRVQSAPNFPQLPKAFSCAFTEHV
ncbi:uncharacterized protein LOC107776935 [Nicotiana tabacum]|uniref:Uncharacterized protein LOC107776935 n=1 Tax=Nicotiana tabacum TaxID=4097 RepID=A0A1S3YJU2_TOBAC|nr:PREDICTED: uncharacterized protein LOC107776935 [Nicotiana tabacum]